MASLYETAPVIPGTVKVPNSPDLEKSSDFPPAVCPAPILHNLSLLGVTYIVRYPEIAWWKGCCFRPKVVKGILSNISLHLQSGEVTALLGNSGSGKTSLLDLVACRTAGHVVGGTYLDGKLMTKRMFREQAGYVVQSDHMLPNLTVRETLTYVAMMKFSSASKAAIRQRVDDILSDMGISHIAESRIGGLLNRGISGGEKRRVSIGCQLLQEPILLLLDEPTTGLDSFTAHYLVQTISRLAKQKNKVILMTIHQPRSDIFRLFDNVGILSAGQMVYFGPGDQMVPHFSALGYPCPTYSNPLDHYLDIASMDRRSKRREQASVHRLEVLKTGYFHSQLFKNTLSDIHNTCHFMDRVETFESNPLGVLAPPGYMKAMGTLVMRMTLNLFRDPMMYLSRFFQLSIFSVFLFLFIFRLQHNQESIQDRIGLLYQSGQTPAYVGLLMAVTLFPPHRDLYYRDAQDGLYSPLVFLNAWCVFTLPLALICSFCFSTINYWALNMYPDPKRYGIYYAVVFLMHYGGEILAVLFMGVIRNVNVANSITSLILALTGLLSSGFLRDVQSMPEALKVLSYGTIFKYSSELFFVNEFHKLELECDHNGTCPVPNGDVLIDALYPGSVENFNRNFGLVGCFVFGYVVLAIITYRVLGYKRSH